MFFSPSARGFYAPELHGVTMPADVIAITEQEHAALLEGQACGQVIGIGKDGRPALFDAAPPPSTVMAARARARRDAALAASDWTQLPDAPLSDAARSAWRAYRAALRALPGDPRWPSDTAWPVAPTGDGA